MKSKPQKQLLTAIFFFLSMVSFAQQEAVLTPPASPAFSILGFEPASVMRPSSHRELGADLLSAFDRDGKLLMNLGLEVSPYWLKSRPYLTKQQYLHPKPGQAFLQSLAISAATVKDSITGNNKLGAGFRFKLFNGQPTKEYEEKSKKLNAQINIVAAVTATIGMVGTLVHTREAALQNIIAALKEMNYSEEVISAFTSAAEKQSENFDDSVEGIRNFLQSINSTVIDANGKLIAQVAELSRKRIGFILEIAGAAGFVTSGGDAFDRAGIWATAANNISVTDAWVASARYLFANRDSALSNFDVGLSYIKELSRFGISAESMLRWYRAEIPDINSGGQPIKRVEKDFTWRIAVQSVYRISNDVSVNISLGKDFNSPFIEGSGFFSILGLNYSLFRKAKVDLNKN